MTTAAGLLREAKKAIEEFGWTQREFGDCSRGFCASGALGFATCGTVDPDPRWAARQALQNAVRRIDGKDGSIPHYNDNPDRTVEEIYTLFDTAIEIAEADAA